MRMSKVTQYKILDLLEEIKGLDEIIKLHEPENDPFMVDQYQARKTKVTKDLIKLILPESDTNSIIFLRQFLDKYYSKKHYSKLTLAKKKANTSLDFDLLQKGMVR